MLPSRNEKGSIRIAKDKQDQNCRINPMWELPIWELPNVRTIRVGTSNYPCGNLQRRGRGNCISPAHCKGSLLPIVTNCCPPIVLLWPSTPPAKPLVAPQAQPFQGGWDTFAFPPPFWEAHIQCLLQQLLRYFYHLCFSLVLLWLDLTSSWLCIYWLWVQCNVEWPFVGHWAHCRPGGWEGATIIKSPWWCMSSLVLVLELVLVL